MEIIYSDNHLLVIVKPADLSTQPHEGEGDNLLDRAKAWVKKEFKKSGNVFLEPIHRLDKPVSGLVLFARTSKALSRLQEQMRQRKISKTYFAWVEGTLPQPQGTLEHYLVHGDHRAHLVSSNHPEAKLARLHYKTLEQKEGMTAVEIDLETGRYHQIRAQFSAIGAPVVGDRKYGSKLPWKNGGIALHHGKLAFEHPVTKEAIILESTSKSV